MNGSAPNVVIFRRTVCCKLSTNAPSLLKPPHHGGVAGNDISESGKRPLFSRVGQMHREVPHSIPVNLLRLCTLVLQTELIGRNFPDVLELYS